MIVCQKGITEVKIQKEKGEMNCVTRVAFQILRITCKPSITPASAQERNYQTQSENKASNKRKSATQTKTTQSANPREDNNRSSTQEGAEIDVDPTNVAYVPPAKKKSKCPNNITFLFMYMYTMGHKLLNGKYAQFCPSIFSVRWHPRLETSVIDPRRS